MASSTPKVVLNGSRDIALNKLVLSQANVRKIKAGISVEDLAVDIGRRGLLQSLNVRPVLDGEGQETGLYEVPAGGRRFQALQLLVKQKRLAKNAPVPCVVSLRDDISAEEDSLAENVQRVSPHPLDQFRAFRTLREERGMSDEEIAAAFFVQPSVVKQRLKLTSVSERLLDLYAEDAMTLEQLMAFTVSNDHARQEQVWEAIQKGYNKEPYIIRRMLIEGKVSASERRAVFVGAAAYEAAGGRIARDLFQQDHGGWFEDVPLLDRLVQEKLQAEAATVAGEGWKWTEVAIDFPWGHTQGLRRVFARVVPRSAEEDAEIAAMRDEMQRIEREHQDTNEDLPEEVDRRLAELEATIASLEERPGIYEPDEVARAGAYVSLAHEGRVRIERGFVRPEDEPAVGATSGDTAEGSGPAYETGSEQPMDSERYGNANAGAATAQAAHASAEEEDGDPAKPLSERLVTELTAHRTLALREALANDPDVAFVAVMHALVLRAFYGQQGYDPASCLEIEAKSAPLSGGPQGLSLGDTSAAQALARMHESWGPQLPKKPAELWDWILDLDRDSRSALFAYCAARTVNGMHETYNRRPSAMVHATRLAEAVDLDMAAQWSATKESYLSRVTKAQILAAVREAKGEAAAQQIDHLKKADMAADAERLLAGTGWLPAILRTPGVADRAGAAEIATEDGAAAFDEFASDDLPAFLTEGGADGADDLSEAFGPAYAVAAE